MTRTGLRPTARPAAGTWAVLVLAVLAGLLAMHALAPVGTPAVGRHAAMQAPVPVHHDVTRRMPVEHAEAGDGCGDCHPAHPGGMAHHADAACAAAGTSTAYAPPALASDTLLTAAFPAPGGEHPAGEADGRAPPDLAQLQLLRI